MYQEQQQLSHFEAQSYLQYSRDEKRTLKNHPLTIDSHIFGEDTYLTKIV